MTAGSHCSGKVVWGCLFWNFLWRRVVGATCGAAHVVMLVVILVPEEDLFYWGVGKRGLAYPR